MSRRSSGSTPAAARRSTRRSSTASSISDRAETLAQHIAEKVRDRQGARRAEVHLDARYPEHKPAPHSGILTQEIYTLHGVAVASAAGTRRLVGVTAQGITACPCAQTLVQAASRERLQEDGFGEDEIERN